MPFGECGLGSFQDWPTGDAPSTVTERTPSAHRSAPLFQSIAAPVRSLRCIPDNVRQRGFCDLARELRRFPNPIPERAPEAHGLLRHLASFAATLQSLARGVESLLPARQKLTRSHDKAMPYQRVPAFMQEFDWVHTRRPLRGVELDMDSSVSPTHGKQDLSVLNGHYACACYHPLFLFNKFG